MNRADAVATGVQARPQRLEPRVMARWLARELPWIVQGAALVYVAIRIGVFRDLRRYLVRTFRPPLRPGQPVPVLAPRSGKWWDRDGYRPTANDLVVYVKPRHVASLEALAQLRSAAEALEPPGPILWVVCSGSADGNRFVQQHHLEGSSVLTDSALVRQHPVVPFAYTVESGERAAQLGASIAHLGSVATHHELTRFFEACTRQDWSAWWGAVLSQHT